MNLGNYLELTHNKNQVIDNLTFLIKGVRNMQKKYSAFYRLACWSLFFFSLVISVVLLSQNSFADKQSHYAVASQLTDLTYNEQLTYETARKFALLAVKNRFENNPKTKDYSDILINLVMEVLDVYFHDVETQNKMRMAYSKTYMEEFTEFELKEFIKFYKTSAGLKALRKLPIVMQKNWQRGSEIGRQISTSPKYERVLNEKLKALKAKGVIPQDF